MEETVKSPLAEKFGPALRQLRSMLGVSQEAFDDVTSRVYVSAIERGLKTPTLHTVEKLATVLQVHPLTLLALASLPEGDHATEEDVDQLLATVRKELLTPRR